MTVGELREKLKGCPDYADVIVRDEPAGVDEARVLDVVSYGSSVVVLEADIVEAQAGSGGC